MTAASPRGGGVAGACAQCDSPHRGLVAAALPRGEGLLRDDRNVGPIDLRLRRARSMRLCFGNAASARGSRKDAARGIRRGLLRSSPSRAARRLLYEEQGVWSGAPTRRLSARARRWGGWALRARRAGARRALRKARQAIERFAPSRRRWTRCAGRSARCCQRRAAPPRAGRGVDCAGGGANR